MKDRDDKRKEEEMRKEKEADRALFLSSFQKAQEPTPLQKAWEQSQLDFLNWESGKDGPLDVTKAPGLGIANSLYRRAAAGQQGERMGQGLITMGTNASSPDLAAKLAQQAKDRREQEAAGGLEEAVALRRAEAHGSVLPLAQLNTNRSLSLAGMAGNQAQGSQGLWGQFRVRPGIGAQLLNSAVQGAAGAATSYATGGLSSMRLAGGGTWGSFGQQLPWPSFS